MPLHFPNPNPNPNPNDDKPQQQTNKWKTLNWSEIANLSVTMSVISPSIPNPAGAEREEKRTDEDTDAEEEEGNDKDNQQMKMAKKFMSSGSRRLKKRVSRRQPEYVEKNVDVKFSDVAGLGKIRLELEEVESFFAALQVHARKKMAADVDYEVVANVTSGMPGAELANHLEITTDDLLEAVEVEQFGMLDNVKWSPEMWRRIALHQAASVVVAVTISPRSVSELGHICRKVLNEVEVDAGLQRLNLTFLVSSDPFGFSPLLIFVTWSHEPSSGIIFLYSLLVNIRVANRSRQSLLSSITVLIAPHAADEMWHGESQLGTMWADTTHKAREAARQFVLGGLICGSLEPVPPRILDIRMQKLKQHQLESGNQPDSGVMSNVWRKIQTAIYQEVKAFQLLLSNLEDGLIECNDGQPVPDIKTKDWRLMRRNYV
ncbi:putative inactive ATP-dependent zinc metalloprotease FTSHI 2, chloroplastic [Drosera capensis]